MPKVCYYKPNRSRPRVFLPCDVARIARKARETTEDGENELIRCIARGLSYSAIGLASQEDAPDDRVSDIVARVTGAIRRVEKALDEVLRLLEPVRGLIDRINDAFREIDEVVEDVEELGDSVPDAIKGKVLKRLAGFAAKFLKRFSLHVRVYEILRAVIEKIDEILRSLQELRDDIDRAAKRIDDVNSVRGMKIYALSDSIKNCECKYGKD